MIRARGGVTAYSQQTFESIKHIDENGAEFWYARELQVALEYTEWRNFEKSSEEIKGQIRNGMCKICTYHF